MRCLVALALLLLSVLPAEQFVSVFRGAQAFALEQRLTLNEAITLALQRHPLLTAARQRIEAARGGLVSAKALPNPSLTAVPLAFQKANRSFCNNPLSCPLSAPSASKPPRAKLTQPLRITAPLNWM